MLFTLSLDSLAASVILASFKEKISLIHYFRIKRSNIL